MGLLTLTSVWLLQAAIGASSESVLKPGSREDCVRKGTRHENTLGCTDGLTLALIYVTATGLLVLVVMQ